MLLRLLLGGCSVLAAAAPAAGTAATPTSAAAAAAARPSPRRQPAAAPSAPNTSPSSSPSPAAGYCGCDDFCANKCSLAGPNRRENRTVYRVTPYNVSGLRDKDTGDAAGDLFFRAISHQNRTIPYQNRRISC